MGGANIKELIDDLSLRLQITKDEARNFISIFKEMIQAYLEGGNKVAIQGLGTFDVVETKAKIGRNPKTGDEMTIPASVRIKFTVSNQLKENVKKYHAEQARKAQLKKPKKKK